MISAAGKQNALRMYNHGLEALAQWMMANGFATGHGESFDSLIAELDWQFQERETRIAAALSAARREEREAIVKLGLSYESDDDLLNRYIASIRALPDGGGKP